MLSFFWWYVNFLLLFCWSFLVFCFFSIVCFTCWSNFISYFVSSQISCSFCFFFVFWATLLDGSIWINFSMVIHEKNGVLNATGVWGDLWFPSPQQVQGRALWGVPGKCDFYCSKDCRLAYNLFIFYLKFSGVWGIFI